MEAIEFSAYLKDGVIKLPKGMESYEGNYVRIIMLREQPDAALKKKLREAILQMQNENIYAHITDALQWQKSIRNEWE